MVCLGLLRAGRLGNRDLDCFAIVAWRGRVDGVGKGCGRLVEQSAGLCITHRMRVQVQAFSRSDEAIQLIGCSFVCENKATEYIEMLEVVAGGSDV